MPIPSKPYEEIAIDFQGLYPLSEYDGCNVVDFLFNFLDTLSGEVIMVPCGEDGLTSHKGCRALSQGGLFALSNPTTIRSDRDVRFTSELWTHVTHALGRTLAVSLRTTRTQTETLTACTAWPTRYFGSWCLKSKRTGRSTSPSCSLRSTRLSTNTQASLNFSSPSSACRRPSRLDRDAEALSCRHLHRIGTRPSRRGPRCASKRAGGADSLRKPATAC